MKYQKYFFKNVGLVPEFFKLGRTYSCFHLGYVNMTENIFMRIAALDIYTYLIILQQEAASAAVKAISAALNTESYSSNSLFMKLHCESWSMDR